MGSLRTKILHSTIDWTIGVIIICCLLVYTKKMVDKNSIKHDYIIELNNNGTIIITPEGKTLGDTIILEGLEDYIVKDNI